jgi:hypothetical protein
MTTVAKQPQKKLESKENDDWLELLYKTDLISDDDLLKMYQEIAYQGFSRDDVLKQLKKLSIDPVTLSKIIITIAVRGPVKASQVDFGGGKTLKSFGITVSGGKGNKSLTANKIAASTADLAAFYLKRLNVPKRMSIDLPGWLQFPTAGSIKLPQKYREDHKEFHRRFSIQIGGQFNEGIYSSMQNNEYLNPSLRLFDN